MIVIKIIYKIICRTGGIDNYTNAISDVYKIILMKEFLQEKEYMMQKYFQKFLKQEIPENTVLVMIYQKDYLRCGLA